MSVAERVLVVIGASTPPPGAEAPAACTLPHLLAEALPPGNVRVIGQAVPAAGGAPAPDLEEAVAWADAVVIHGGGGLGEPAARAAICASQLRKTLVVCHCRPTRAERALARWVLEHADAVLVSDEDGAAHVRAISRGVRPVLAAPGADAGRVLALLAARRPSGTGSEQPGSEAEGVSGAPGAPPPTALVQRVRDLERSLESALGELGRIHGSRLWRLGEFYWTIRPAALLAVRRITHPVETIRVAAPGLLPVRLRARLARALRPRTANGHDATLAADDAGEALERLASASGPHPTVIFLPIIEWGFRHQRPQQLASALAAGGWPVLYASCSFGVGGTGVELESNRKADGVFGVRLPSVRHLDVYRDTIDPRSLAVMVAAVKAFRRQAGIREGVVVCQLPFWRPLASALRRELGWPTVYDLLDDHAGFTTNSKAMLREEERLLADADLVLASSKRLEDSARRVNVHTVRVPNGCDWPRWSEPSGLGLLPEPKRPIVGYFGAISEWFDVRLVAALAEARPAWSFVLVGSTYGADVGRLARLPNVHLLGERPYVTLPGIASQFDAGIIPFRRTPLTEATDPVKVYEMLALGLDVVATPLPELAAHGDLVRLASTPEEFLSALDDAVAHPGDAAAVARRRRFAYASRWELRAESLAAAIPGLYPLVSIVIATHNNQAFTRMCLESIWRNTAYPNYEVIVVDNGSTDGTHEILEEMARVRRALTVVTNERNLGFAAACNQGLRLAEGWVLCMLNNDTVVAPGWLSPMVQALRNDRRVGMVGPVSNAVGNEARIQVGYSGVEEMPAWAARWVAQHEGEALELPMLALFCAAMRREVWQEIGELDERFEVGMFEDDDYCRRVRQAGYKLLCLRDAFVHHWQRATFRLLGDEEFERIYERNRQAYEAKWQGRTNGK